MKKILIIFLINVFLINCAELKENIESKIVLKIDLKDDSNSKNFNCDNIEILTNKWSVFLCKLIGKDRVAFNEEIVLSAYYKNEAIEALNFFHAQGYTPINLKANKKYSIMVKIKNNSIHYIGYSQSNI